tara:strand:- start:7009 stop:7224 length:216 start_codon:yes stop_codon:yes gene_type:complete
MSEETNTTQENLNDVENLEKTTSGLDYTYKTSNDAGRLYKNIIKSLANYSKGELFTTEDIRNLIRNEYETL